MPSEKEILMIQKATMFDFKQILEANPDKTYTVEELKHLIDTYIAGAGQYDDYRRRPKYENHLDPGQRLYGR